MTEKHTFLSPKGPNYLCLTCGNPDEHEIHGKTYAKRPVEGATGAREWLKEKHLDTFLVISAERCRSSINDERGRLYGCSRLSGHDGPCETAPDRYAGTYLKEAPTYALPELLEAYASSQLKKLDGVAQQAAEKIAAMIEDDQEYWRKVLPPIISKVIAERLSK